MQQARANRRPTASAPHLAFARVEGRVEGRFRVVTESGESAWAGKADGCLLMPETGDLVLIAGDDSGTAYVLSVLVKRGADARIELPGQVSLSADRIALSGRHGASIEAPELSLSGVSARASFQDFNLAADTCGARFRQASLVVKWFDTAMERVTERVRNRFRWVTGTEQTIAGRLRTLVAGRCQLQARHVSVQAEEEVSLDGKKIHLG